MSELSVVYAKLIQKRKTNRILKSNSEKYAYGEIKLAALVDSLHEFCVEQLFEKSVCYWFAQNSLR